MYALAATAAGVGVLVLAQPADAKIIYTKAKKFIGRNSTLHLDLNHDGIPDFDLKDTYRTYSYSCAGELAVAADRQKNAIWGHTVRSQGYASALYANVQIGPKGHFVSRGEMAAGSFTGGDRRASASGAGPWDDVKNRYLGLKFQIKGETHYGWARLNVSVQSHGPANVTATLTGYAYETVPDKPIIAGKTKGTDVITVQPASLGHLAKGASAVPRWRAKPALQATQ